MWSLESLKTIVKGKMKASRGLALLLFAFLLFSSSLARRLSSATGQATFINGTCFVTATPPPTTTMASPVPPASSSSPVPPSPASPSRRPTLLTGLRVGFAAGVVAVVVAVAVLLIYCGKKNRQPLVPTPSAPQSSDMRIFTLDEIKQCTKNLASLIGRGGFGCVYHGVLSNGKEVAVKILNKGDGQNDCGFETEVENLRRAHHKHVVSLVGYCIEEGQQIVVYEYVPNNTLNFHLHSHGAGRRDLNWPERLKIALGSAKGLAYLHEYCHPKIIHRDIKATNILLDRDFEAKIADFGLAKCISESETHVSTAVRGTPGYLDPEYWQSSQLTEKTDIYSFGMVLLQLITGRKLEEGQGGLYTWVLSQLPRDLKGGNFDSIVDPRLQNVYDREEMARMVRCAVACVYHFSNVRPKMSEIVRALEGHPNLPQSPTHLHFREGPGPSSDAPAKASKCPEKTPLGNQKNGSSHHREPTPGSRKAGPSRPPSQDREMRKM